MTAALSLASHEQTLHTSPHCFSDLLWGILGASLEGKTEGSAAWVLSPPSHVDLEPGGQERAVLPEFPSPMEDPFGGRSSVPFRRHESGTWEQELEVQRHISLRPSGLLARGRHNFNTMQKTAGIGECTEHYGCTKRKGSRSRRASGKGRRWL